MASKTIGIACQVKYAFWLTYLYIPVLTAFLFVAFYVFHKEPELGDRFSYWVGKGITLTFTTDYEIDA